MKKKYILLILAIVAVFVVAVVLIIRRNANRWKTVELTDDAKDYVQIWDITKAEPVRSHYMTGADRLTVNLSSPRVITNFSAADEGWYIPGETTFYPVKKGFFPDGESLRFNPDNSFVNASSLKLQ